MYRKRRRRRMTPERKEQMRRLAVLLKKRADREERIECLMSFMPASGDYWFEGDQTGFNPVHYEPY